MRLLAGTKLIIIACEQPTGHTADAVARSPEGRHEDIHRTHHSESGNGKTSFSNDGGRATL